MSKAPVLSVVATSDEEINVHINAIKEANYAVPYDQEYHPPTPYNEDGTVTLNLKEMQKDFLQVLKEHVDRSIGKKITNFLKKDRSLEEAVSSLRAAAAVLSAVNDPKKTIFEVQYQGKWYPVRIQAQYERTFFGPILSVVAPVKLWCVSEHLSAIFTPDDFIIDEEHVSRTVRELLESKGFRLTTPEAIEFNKKQLQEASALGNTYGKVVNLTGKVCTEQKHWFGDYLEHSIIGSEAYPVQAIVEGELEGGKDDDEDEGVMTVLPYVRVFIPKMKQYGFVELDTIKPYIFDLNAHENIVLPEKTRSVMNAIFLAGQKSTFGDAFAGRHGGMVILANGPSGVGKTLTAEVFAEMSSRPLYVMEMGELGTDLAGVEKALQLIFARAKRWNAVLLFDEADIFLARRNDDLERSAIVGVFLRLLDYYEGMFFLTTNRGDVIDDAMKSRITLRLDYEELTDTARFAVWNNLLKRGNFEVTDPENLSQVAKKALNGRQIRNQVRLLSVLYPDRKITTENILDATQFIA